MSTLVNGSRGNVEEVSVEMVTVKGETLCRVSRIRRSRYRNYRIDEIHNIYAKHIIQKVYLLRRLSLIDGPFFILLGNTEAASAVAGLRIYGR